ncbi:hypothetical protein JKF63_07169 [Porcisia hertigi]|uniref:Uncharacterized protein n=1 Tax=Porcisia hertigi TaxID=2761500 RepID=A0A836LKG4_9TRYP|nr:hypothetical protein JKF63_07169 [Porcisia hertigi]
MPRIRAARAAWHAGRELDAYLRLRAWHWSVKRNYALAADYCIRLLNRHPQDTLGLVLGEVAGRNTSQETFAAKCAQTLQESCQRKGVTSVADLLHSTFVTTVSSPSSSVAASTPSLSQHPAPADVLALHAEAHNAGVEANGLKNESLYVHNSEPEDFAPQAVRRSCLRSATPPLAELLEPAQTTYGRGLYATRHIPPRCSILCEAPLLVQRCDDTKCAHCLAPLSARSGSSGTGTGLKDAEAFGIACPHCEQETYCSAGCKDAAWEQYHVCSCASRNPELAQWTQGMRELLYRRSVAAASPESDEANVGNSGSEARAALSCLTVAKICAMATVQQVHPLSLPGLSCLRGIADYEPSTALSEIGALAVALSAALRQPNLYMEEVLSLFALLQTNEFFTTSGIALYSVLSLLNHSCDPNCALVSASISPAVAAHHGTNSFKNAMEKYLIALRPIRDGEQLFIDYNAALTTKLSYEDRKALCLQRHFECYCIRCIRRM